MGRWVSEDFQRLDSFLSICPDGTQLRYQDIAAGSGVMMDTDGKACLRRVLAYAQREYLCQRGIGIVLVDQATTLPALSQKTQRVDRSIERTHTTYRNTQRFFSALSPEEQKQALFLGSVLGAWSATAAMLARTYAPQRMLDAQQDVTRPDLT